jgi:hypothetical protein
MNLENIAKYLAQLALQNHKSTGEDALDALEQIIWDLEEQAREQLAEAIIDEQHHE